MLDYNLNDDYELIPKHCPKCQALVMAKVVKNLDGVVYKYRDIRCSECDWESPLKEAKAS